MENSVEIKDLIYVIRGQKVMLDSDLAMLYEVTTKRLNEAVKRNKTRFPAHYMFQLTENLRSQIATSSKRHGGRRYMPYVFTEQGVAIHNDGRLHRRMPEVLKKAFDKKLN